MERTVCVLVRLLFLSTCIDGEAFSLGRPVNILCTIGPQSLHLVAIHHGLDECIEDSLLTGVVSITVINDNPYRSFSVQVRANLSDRSQLNQLLVNTVLDQVIGQSLIPGTCPVSKYT